MKQVLIFDNYDSFTHNLYHLLFRVCGPGYEFTIKRNRDREIFTLSFDILIISPGPMGPAETGILGELFQERIIPEAIPTLGICLGMQFLAYFYGCRVLPSAHPVHGRRVMLHHTGLDLFAGAPAELQVARYNSLEVLPGEQVPLLLLAHEVQTEMIMALRHNNLPFAGVQFHPESFLTQSPELILDNFFRQYVAD